MRRVQDSGLISRSQLLLQYLLATGTIAVSNGSSAAVIPFDAPARPPALQMAGAVCLPEDGFGG